MFAQDGAQSLMQHMGGGSMAVFYHCGRKAALELRSVPLRESPGLLEGFLEPRLVHGKNVLAASSLVIHSDTHRYRTA
jgi:hypothetical protein